MPQRPSAAHPSWERMMSVWNAPIYETVFVELAERNSCRCAQPLVDDDRQGATYLTVDLCRACGGVAGYQMRCTDGKCTPVAEADGYHSSNICEKCRMPTCRECGVAPVRTLDSICPGCRRHMAGESVRPGE